MLTNEQILLRMGVDARAVQTGLEKTGVLIRGWGTSMAHHLKGALGGFFAFAAVEQFFDRMKERILEIKSLSRETGFSTNFIQGAQLRVASEGKDPNGLTGPLTAVSAEAGKRGMTGLQLLGNLAEGYEKLNTQEERNAFLKSQQIKGWQELIPLMEGGRKAVQAMDADSPFKITSENISAWGQTWAAIKTTFLGGGALFANMSGFMWRQAINAGVLISTLPTLRKGGLAYQLEVNRQIDKFAQKSADTAELQALADQDKVSLGQKTLEILEQEKQLRNEIKNTQDEINDRGKDTLDQLADTTRRLLGRKEIRHTVTARGIEALKIKDLEARAEREWEAGNDDAFRQDMTIARQIRLSAGWASAKDRDPTLKLTQHVEEMNNKMELLRHPAEMAERVNRDQRNQNKE